MNKNIKIKDIKEINLNKVFLHYTNEKNLESISKEGLKPQIGMNSKGAEISKKFSLQWEN